MFRDDKSYPYLMITGTHSKARFSSRRQGKAQPHFGPFPHAHACARASLLQRASGWNCEDRCSRTPRPCCCTDPALHRALHRLITAPRYAEDVRSAELFLEGREDDVTRLLTERMDGASAERRYEDAALFRDQIRALSRVQARQYVESNRGVDADVVACVAESGLACVNLAMIRSGRHVGDRSFFPQNAAGDRRRRSSRPS